MSKGSARREEDSRKIAANWDRIFSSKLTQKQALEDYKEVLEIEELKKVCIMDLTVLGMAMASCPCQKCNPVTM